MSAARSYKSLLNKHRFPGHNKGRLERAALFNDRRRLLSCASVKLRSEDFDMEKKRTQQLTASVCFKKILVFVAMAIIWYVAQMMVYAEVLIILARLNGHF